MVRAALGVLNLLLRWLAIAGIITLGSCSPARTILKQAPLTANPSDIQTVGTWRSQEQIKSLLENYLYGPVPTDIPFNVLKSEVLNDQAFDGTAILHQWTIEVAIGSVRRTLDVVAVLPKNVAGAPIIISQNFCPNPSVVPADGVNETGENNFCDVQGLSKIVMTSMFGRYIVAPPMENLIERGYGFAATYPSQVVPDNREGGLSVLAEMFPNEEKRPGALAVWGALYPIIGETILQEYGPRPQIAYGHSRYGKTALIGGAFFEQIDAVIAHQSGALGASDFSNGVGESLENLSGGFPHWPSPKLRDLAETPDRIPVSAAELLYLNLDKPVLLGNARRDVWADPYGAFTAAKAAFPDTMSARDPKDFIPSDRHAYWIRPGTHGIVKEDWPAFLEFLDAHFKHGVD